jgi:hypothetical protein
VPPIIRKLIAVQKINPGHPGCHSGKMYAAMNRNRPTVNNSPAAMHGIDFRSIVPSSVTQMFAVKTAVFDGPLALSTMITDA